MVDGRWAVVHGRWAIVHGLVAVIAVSVACGGTTRVPTAPDTSDPAAVHASSLSSFEGMEEPEVLYRPSSGTFTSDSYTNITEPSSGIFRFTLRYRPAEDWWDGDRTTTNDDRQRAEVKGLGVHQKNGETFEYATTWRTTRGGAGKFWHVFQLKATDGDDDAPLVVLSLQSGSTAAVRYWPGTASNFIVARAFTYPIGDWTTVKIRVKVSTAADGQVMASVNGDGFQGTNNVAVFRPQSTDYRPKWGSYRGVDANEPYGDDYVEHTDVTAQRIR